jgi:RNA polymerase sigma-54 factor
MKSVLENLHLLGSGKFALLRQRSGCSVDELSSIFKKIKSFDPKPGLQFDISDAVIREPDLHVKETLGGWTVELNNSTLPNVQISKEFAKKVNQQVTEKSEREFIREKITEAKWLQNAINKRNETMLKVGSEIIKRQTAFLEKGAEYIQPMILNDIAEAVGMHESTISRVTTGSLIQTPRGTLELKTFFSVGIHQGTGSTIASASSIKHKVRKLIDQEDPRSPISDDLIVKILSDDGVKVARRTVAKYRKLNNIPSSFTRKRQNVLAGVINQD